MLTSLVLTSTVQNFPSRSQIDILEIDTVSPQQTLSSSPLLYFERASGSIPGIPMQEFLVITEPMS